MTTQLDPHLITAVTPFGEQCWGAESLEQALWFVKEASQERVVWDGAGDTETIRIPWPQIKSVTITRG